jgi:site-specific recombinase XerD
MIERFLKRPRVQQRLERSPLASVVEAFVAHLDGRGYSKTTVQAYLQAAAHFALWLCRSRRSLDQTDETAVELFLTRHLPRCRCPAPRSRTTPVVRAALHQLVMVLRSTDRLPKLSPPAAPADAVLASFELHLTHTCGAAPATRLFYVRQARDLLVARFGTGPVDLAALTSTDVREFVTGRSRVLTPASTNAVGTAMRSFLRFLHLQGCASAGAALAVPRTANWRLASLPSILTDDELTAFLTVFDRTTSMGRRNYAIALCLSGLGLRAGEVARLTLDDVDWRAGTVAIAPGKGRRADRLPLPAHIVEALADYLRHGRPETRARFIFVHHRAPRGQGGGPSLVRSAVRLAYARAGLDARFTGTHVLRHTAATRLLRSGASMKEVADVLRHRSLDTSAIYAKVDLSALAGVALPWPGEVRS